MYFYGEQAAPLSDWPGWRKGFLSEMSGGFFLSRDIVASLKKPMLERYRAGDNENMHVPGSLGHLAGPVAANRPKTCKANRVALAAKLPMSGSFQGNI